MADTASYANGMSMLTYTDINGNFSDTLDLYDSVGVVFAYADNNCNNTGASNVFAQSYSFGSNLPSTVSYTASFITCSSNSGGGGSGGSNDTAQPGLTDTADEGVAKAAGESDLVFGCQGRSSAAAALLICLLPGLRRRGTDLEHSRDHGRDR